MRISHEAICQALFIEGCGALRREFVACLRSGRALPAKAGTEQACRAHHRRRRAFRASRPGSRPGRARPLGGQPDHRHRPVGDLVPLVERRSRSTLLVHLLRLDGWGEKPTVKNGPALGGSGAVAMNAALVASMTDLPQQLRRTLAWDRGKELSGHAECAGETGTKVYFADPHSPWQRPTNENTNGLLRQYSPRGHRPVPMQRRRPGGCRARNQQQTPEGLEPENADRGVQQAATVS